MTAFSFESFRFIGNYPFIYIHCETFVCVALEPLTLCDRSCITFNLLAKTASESGEEIRLDQGPLYFAEYPPTEEDLKNAPISTDPPPMQWGSTTTPIFGPTTTPAISTPTVSAGSTTPGTTTPIVYDDLGKYLTAVNSIYITSSITSLKYFQYTFFIHII